MRHLSRTLLWFISVVPLVCMAPMAAAAEQTPSGTISLETISIAAGAGVQWGNGRLTLNDGRQYNFAVRGLDVGSVGISKVNAEGKVYNLNTLADFAGTYLAAEASVALGGGGPGVIAMHNQHGVAIELWSVQQGAKLTIGAQGVQITLEE
jgi:hypothetical protein